MWLGKLKSSPTLERILLEPWIHHLSLYTHTHTHTHTHTNTHTHTHTHPHTRASLAAPRQQKMAAHLKSAAHGSAQLSECVCVCEFVCVCVRERVRERERERERIVPLFALSVRPPGCSWEVSGV